MVFFTSKKKEGEWHFYHDEMS